MSPVNKSAKERLQTDPPFFHPDRDLQEWRRDIGRWVDLILAAAEKGNDRHFSTVAKILGRTLYERGLPSAKKSIVDEAQAKQVIDYRQDDQVEAVREIVNLIAVDPPIAGVSRLISSFNKVTSCERKQKEDLTMFVSRFRGLAADHLVQVNASSSSQIGEVLAITLLNNAKLAEGTLTNAKMSLIALAEDRARREAGSATVEVPERSITEAASVTESLKAAINAILIDDGDQTTTPQSRLLILNKVEEVRVKVASLNRSNADRSKSVADMFASNEKRTRLHLDDAVTVLNNLSVTPANNPSGVTMEQVESLFAKQLDAYFTRFQGLQGSFDWNRVGQASGIGKNGMFGNNRNRNNRSSNGRTSSNGTNDARLAAQLKSRKRPSIDRPIQDVFDPNACRDCGETTHERGDDACPRPSAYTRFLKRRRKDKNQEGGEDKEGNGEPFFRRSSQSRGN